MNVTTFCTSAVVTFAVLGFWAAHTRATAAITKTATINPIHEGLPEFVPAPPAIGPG
jgi:hypothetical protein